MEKCKTFTQIKCGLQPGTYSELPTYMQSGKYGICVIIYFCQRQVIWRLRLIIRNRPTIPIYLHILLTIPVSFTTRSANQYLELLHKKNVLILTCVVEHISPGNKYNCLNGLYCRGHMTRNSRYINQPDRSLKCSIVCQYSNYCVSIPYSVFGIIQEWRDYKETANITLWIKNYKSGDKEKFWT